MNRKNFRERRKKFIMCFGAFVIIACFSLSIAYAALSETLKISGSAGVQAADWNMNLTFSKSAEASSGVTYTTPDLTGTSVGEFTVNFSKPGFIKYELKLSIDGDYNAILDSIVKSTPVCTSDTGNEEDEKNVCDNIDISVDWGIISNFEGDMNIGDVVSPDGHYCNVGETAGGYSSYILIYISYYPSVKELTSSTVTVSNLGFDFIFSITDQECVYDKCYNPYAAC